MKKLTDLIEINHFKINFYSIFFAVFQRKCSLSFSLKMKNIMSRLERNEEEEKRNEQ